MKFVELKQQLFDFESYISVEKEEKRLLFS